MGEMIVAGALVLVSVLFGFAMGRIRGREDQ